MWNLESVQAHTQNADLYLTMISCACGDQPSLSVLSCLPHLCDRLLRSGVLPCRMCLQHWDCMCVQPFARVLGRDELRFSSLEGSYQRRHFCNPLQSTFHMYVGWKDRSIGKVPATQVQGPEFSSRSPTPREFTFICNTGTCRERYQERGRYLELFS